MAGSSEQEHKAATRIQSVYRGHASRKLTSQHAPEPSIPMEGEECVPQDTFVNDKEQERLQKEKEKQIQEHEVLRKQLQKEKEQQIQEHEVLRKQQKTESSNESTSKSEHEAAIKIQAVYRGHSARKQLTSSSTLAGENPPEDLEEIPQDTRENDIVLLEKEREKQQKLTDEREELALKAIHEREKLPPNDDKAQIAEAESLEDHLSTTSSNVEMSPDGEELLKSSEPAPPPEKEINGAWNLEGLEQVDEKKVHEEREVLLKLLEERKGEVAKVENEKLDSTTQSPTPSHVELQQKLKDSADKEKEKGDKIHKLTKEIKDLKLLLAQKDTALTIARNAQAKQLDVAKSQQKELPANSTELQNEIERQKVIIESFDRWSLALSFLFVFTGGILLSVV